MGESPGRVSLREVGPRDGLQNEHGVVPTDLKLAFVDALAAAGLADIEVSSFVRPDRVPQLADAEELFSRSLDIDQLPRVREKVTIPRARFLQGIPIVQVLTLANLTASNSEAARLIRSGGISLNDTRVTDERMLLTPSSTLDGELLVLSKGKKQRVVVQLTDELERSG